MPMQWDTRPADALEGLAVQYASAIHAGVFAIVQRRAPEIQNWMKENAPWTDRTGNARQGLHTDPNQVINQLVWLILSHGVDYGVYLEHKNAGRFAIVSPAIDHWAPIIWADVQRMLAT